MTPESIFFHLPPRSTEMPAEPPRPARETVPVTVDGRRVEVPAGATLLEACQSLGIDVPTLCYLETLTPEIMLTHFERRGKPVPENAGTLLLRNIDHYWFHTGEAHAIRQMLGHENLPDFVGNISVAAYRPE